MATRTSSTTSPRAARLAPGSRRRDPPAADRRRGRARRQQQRGRGAAGAGGARRGTRGARVPRRADRDRRRLPHPGRARPLGRPARRGGDDEPNPRRRLRAGGRAGDGRAAARAPVELPRASASPTARRSRSWPRSPPHTTSRLSTTSARARSCRLGGRAAGAREPRRRRGPRLLLRRQAAGRAAGGRSSSGGRSSWRGCGAIPSSARCAPTSSRSPRSRAR